MTTAFDPIDLSRKPLANRIAMTRSRADAPAATPTELMATYYAQRASASLIVTEGIQPSVRATPTLPACTPPSRSTPGGR